MTPFRVVSPYSYFEPESAAHQKLGPFDWVGALSMLFESVRRSNDCDAVALTDPLTKLPVSAFRYEVRSTRLMPWILDVSLAYLRSEDFDRDTWFLSPDMLVFGDLRPWHSDSAIVMVRKKFIHHPILNGVQFWPIAQKAALVAFFAQAVAICRDLPDNLQRWGGDTEPLRQLLMPLSQKTTDRAGLRVRMIESSELMQSYSDRMLKCRPAARPVRPILDFRYLRKQSMRAYFDATIRSRVAA